MPRHLICLYSVLGALCMSACGNHSIPVRFNGPDGLYAEVFTKQAGASSSNSTKVVLKTLNSKDQVTVFEGSGGSDPRVIFMDKLVIVEYCYPSEFKVKGYVYSVGSDLTNTDIRIAALTFPLQSAEFSSCRNLE